MRAGDTEGLAVTGATGYVGRQAAQVLRSEGHRVIELNNRLGVSPDPKVFSGAGVLIHFAYDYSRRGRRDISKINVEGTRLLVEAARIAGVRRIILLSSFAAFPGCRSLYGKAKLECERIVQSAGGTVIRAGLIFGGGDGGVVAAMEKWVRTLPVIPIVSSDSVLYVCHIEDLCRLISELLHRDGLNGSLIYAANSVPNRFEAVLKHLQGLHHRAQPLIHVGWRIPWLVLRILEGIGFNPPFHSDGVIGIIDQNRDPDFSTLAQFQTTFRNIL